MSVINNFNINSLIKNKKIQILIPVTISILLSKSYYYNFCIRKTFDRLDKLFPRLLEWEKELDIYSVALPKFYTKIKKPKCILLISGYRDIPYVWNDLFKYFVSNNLDFYAPRTCGKGRSFF